jgi:hypothetical protein
MTSVKFYDTNHGFPTHSLIFDCYGYLEVDGIWENSLCSCCLGIDKFICRRHND